MGAYLYFKTESNPNEVANYLLEENQLNKKLFEEWEEQNIYINCDEDIEWAKKERPDLVDMFQKEYGTGSIKTSGGISWKFNEAGYEYEDLAEMWIQIFEELNKRFKMKYYANSCAFTENECYFSLEQMKRITDNGKLLSGKTAKSDRARELYDKYYKLFSEPEKEIFDISKIEINDTVLLDDGKWYNVLEKYGDLKLNWLGSDSIYSFKKVKDIVDKIIEHKKYVPKIRYGGSVCDIESYILDDVGTLIYLETVGTENMVKSITSVLMQGRVKMNDHTIDASFGVFSINKAGNKRKIISLDDGLAHAIVYHSPSIVDTNFSVLIGRDKDELLNSFSAWLEKSQPLPYPKELTKDIYKKLQDREKLEEFRSLNIEAVKVDLSVLEDEYNDLMEVILEVCKENGLVPENAKPLKQQFPLPKSNYLREEQVQKIYDTLNKMPKTYELENVDIKPIGLKLFSPNMTLYIIEADKGCEDDEFENMHTQCYGYIKNESDPQMSEWGYINIPYYLEMDIPIRVNGTSGRIGNMNLGFEQDLHFEDMYIDLKGKVGKKEDFDILVA